MKSPLLLFRDIVRVHCRERPDYLSYRFLDNAGNVVDHLTVEKLDVRARSIALHLLARTEPGDRVLLVFGAGLEFIEAFFACQYAGVIAVPIFPPTNPASVRRLTGILNQVTATIALTRTEDAGSVAPLAEQGVSVIEVNRIEPRHESWTEHLREPRDEVFLQFTSGSTGTPKGVVVTQKNLLANEAMIRDDFGHDATSTFVSWLPHCHDMGLVGGILQPLFVGSECVLLSPETFLRHPVRWLEAISRYQAKTSGAPNFAYELCVARKPGEEALRALDLSSWRVAFCGAEPVRKKTLEDFAAAYGPAGFRPGSLMPCYGMAETTLLVANRRLTSNLKFDERQRPEAQERRTLTSCGHAASGSEVVIVDLDARKEVPAGVEGEILVKGEHVAAGYWNMPEATASTFHVRLADGRGPYLRTGDLGYLRDAELFISGRTKDVLIAFGQNIHATDVEEIVGQAHPRLRRSGVAAFSNDDGQQERITVTVEVPSLPPKDLAEIKTAVLRQAHQQLGIRIDELIFVPLRRLPRTTSGKIERGMIRDLYRSGDLPQLKGAICPESIDLPAGRA